MPRKIAIVDDFFPHGLGGFRHEEFARYLDTFPELTIYCDGNSIHCLPPARSPEEAVTEHVARYPQHRGRIMVTPLGVLPDAEAYYFVFIQNAFRYLDQIESSRKPFAFTLYPGGGFQIGDPGCDDRLRRVLTSPMLHRAVVTMPITRDYVLKMCPEAASKMLYLYGGVLPNEAFEAPPPRKPHQDELHIGFIANRNLPRGEDKGYDVFIGVARELAARGIKATFHAVGPWGADIIPLGEAASQFAFWGFLPTDELRALSRTLDLVISPNRPWTLGDGYFDGFPTGGCAEAGLQGAAMFCSDELDMRGDLFQDGEDIVIIRPDVVAALGRIEPLLKSPAKVRAIGSAGRSRMIELFGTERQMSPRISMLKELAA